MASAKAIQISKDIDIARCSGNWAVIPELARRYKKYYSEGTGELNILNEKKRYVCKLTQIIIQ